MEGAPPRIPIQQRPSHVKIPTAEHYQGATNQFPRCYSPGGRAYGIRRAETPDAVDTYDQYPQQSYFQQPVQFPVNGVFGNTYESSKIPPVQFPTEPLFATTVRPTYKHPPISFPDDPIRINNTGMVYPPTVQPGIPLRTINGTAPSYNRADFRENVPHFQHAFQQQNLADVAAIRARGEGPMSEPLQGYPAADHRFDAGYPATFAANANATYPISEARHQRAQNSYPAQYYRNDPTVAQNIIPASQMQAQNTSTVPAAHFHATQTGNTVPASSFKTMQAGYSQPALNLARYSPDLPQNNQMHATNLTNGPDSRDPQQLALHGLRNVALQDQHLISGPNFFSNPNDRNAPLSQPAPILPRGLGYGSKSRPLPTLPPKQLSFVTPPNVPSLSNHDMVAGRGRVQTPGVTQYARNMAADGVPVGPPQIPLASRPPATYAAASQAVNEQPPAPNSYFPQTSTPPNNPSIQANIFTQSPSYEIPISAQQYNHPAHFNAYVVDGSSTSASSRPSTPTDSSTLNGQTELPRDDKSDAFYTPMRSGANTPFINPPVLQQAQSEDAHRQQQQQPENIPLPPDIETVEHEQPQQETPSVPTIRFEGEEPEEKGDTTAPTILFSIAHPAEAKRPESSYTPKITEVLDHKDGAEGNAIGDQVTTRSLANDLTCAGCSLPISGRTLSAMSRRWHPDCFQCSHCHEGLEHVAFFEHDNQPFCHFDYQEQFGRRCHQCKTPIEDENFITLDDPVLGRRDYHELHFFCSDCGDPFLDPRSLRKGSEAVAKPFVVHDGWAYCDSCNIKLHKPKCKACKKPIEDEVVRAMNADWHEDCFKCSRCEKPLEESFLTRENAPYCEECYKILLRSDV